MILKPLVLDASPLSLLCHPDLSIPIVAEINQWLEAQDVAGRKIHIPEIAHYEVRRELVRLRKIRSIRRLDALIESTSYLPLNTATVLRACEFWAQARQQGLPTASADALDADVILAAQTERAGGVVATHNIGHLSRFVDARHWRDI